MSTVDQRVLHRKAISIANTYVDPIVVAERELPTPCAEWNLGELLAHMVGQHFGFAQAVREGNAPKSAYRPVPFSPRVWRQSTQELLDAFAGADLEDSALEVELHPTQPLPLPMIIGAQLLDTVVHTWDVARSLGQPFEPGEDLAAAVFAIAQPIPDDERRDQPGAAFGHALPATGSPWQQTLRLLGRDPLVFPIRRPAPVLTPPAIEHTA
ncbi:TIGR03086 family metal-binding protein [Nakamurella lactea]|uniref:TIGR03086 family metal-binding protein n=1 Tax=Nakamurella lactea TaxID=459515 RepID=UPI0003FCD29D|nr:TIGR03086 family metal-binding protein [Nakamurella lactea]